MLQVFEGQLHHARSQFRHRVENDCIRMKERGVGHERKCIKKEKSKTSLDADVDQSSQVKERQVWLGVPEAYARLGMWKPKDTIFSVCRPRSSHGLHF